MVANKEHSMTDDNDHERTLSPGEVIEVKPGMGFGKRIRWKRGR